VTPGRAVTLLVSTVAVAALCVAAGAQDLPRPTFRAGVDVVHVDVSVLDKDRRPVRGLGAADFTVLEGGTPRPIVAFASVELPPRAPEDAAPWVRDVPSDLATNTIAPEGRLVVVLVGRTGDITEIVAARRIAKAAIDGLGPGDLGALVYASDAFRPGTTQNFTPDKARLRQAVDSRKDARKGRAQSHRGEGRTF
jgi:VWFA-related protein